MHDASRVLTDDERSAWAPGGPVHYLQVAQLVAKEAGLAESRRVPAEQGRRLGLGDARCRAAGWWHGGLTVLVHRRAVRKAATWQDSGVVIDAMRRDTREGAARGRRAIGGALRYLV